jgi:tetratricopeptide (TPR) repeat protein
MEQAAAQSQDAAWDLYEQGLQAQNAGEPDKAATLLDAAIRLRPAFPEALCAGAFLLQTQGRAAAALAFYDRALSLKPADPVAWFNRGLLLLAARRADEALQSFDRACALSPDQAGYHCNRGAALYDLGRLAEAAFACERALALEPSLAKAALNLGNALMRLGRYAEARDAYRRALETRPDYALAWCGLGIVAKEMGRFGEAMGAFDHALALEPESAEALSNRGCLQLLLGDFASGWEGYEYRWERKQRPIAKSEARFDLSSPDDLAGRRILVVNDHGLGDTIQFFRYVVLLARAGARVTFAGPAKLRRLLASSGAAVDWREEGDLGGAFDERLAISSLPRAFATRLDTIPTPTPYLFAEAGRIARWRTRLAGPGLKIGLCWRGNVDFRVDPRRSIPPEALAPLLECDGARFFSLQKGGGADALAGRIEDFGEALDSGADAFVDTAAIMAGLDLIVTCDTSIAHLAGALGRPVWVALRHVAEWRWLHGRPDSPWYPSMRLFRADEGDDWRALFAAMARALCGASWG